MLVFNEEQKIHWEKISDEPVFVVGAPFVHYRKSNNIEKDPLASGTIVFPAHTGSTIEVISNRDSLIRCVNSLDTKYLPITICLHENDYKSHERCTFEDKGFRVVWAGPKNSRYFLRNFYHLLKQHKYACSDAVGTHVLICAEMGIPFFFLGDKPKLFDTARNVEPHGTESYRDRLAQDKDNLARELFAFPKEDVTIAQRRFVDVECGVMAAVPPKQLKKYLFQCLLFRSWKRPLKYLTRVVISK